MRADRVTSMAIELKVGRKARRTPLREELEAEGVEQGTAPLQVQVQQPQPQAQGSPGAVPAQQTRQAGGERPVQLSVSVGKEEYGPGEAVSVVVRDASPGAAVEVEVYGPGGELVYVARGSADASGTFYATFSKQLGSGAYRVVARQGGASGEASFRVAQRVQPQAQEPPGGGVQGAYTERGEFFGYIEGVYVYGRGAREPPPTPEAMRSLKNMMRCPDGYELYVEWDSGFGHYIAMCCARWGTDGEGRRGCVGASYATYCAKRYGQCEKREFPAPPCQWIPETKNWLCGRCQANWVNCVPEGLDIYSRVLCTGCTP